MGEVICGLGIMRIIKTEKQKDNIAKFLYDMAKIYFAVAVLGPFTKPEITDKYTLTAGVIATIILFLTANIMDSKKFKNNE